MITFKQNNEITYDDKDLMEENSFIGAEIEKTPIPVFSEIKDKLPQPVWENHGAHIDLLNEKVNATFKGKNSKNGCVYFCNKAL